MSHQTVYAPFRPGNPFVQALGVDLRLQIIGNLQLQLGTYTTPAGGVRYTVSGRQWLSASTGGGASRRGFRLPRYIVRGRVVDETGRPVEGAVVRLGSEPLMTDRDGRFSLRLRRPGRIEVSVLLDQFAAPGRYAVTSAPTHATAATDAGAPEVLITVRRH